MPCVAGFLIINLKIYNALVAGFIIMIRKYIMPCITGRAEEPSVRPLDRLTSVLHHLQHHHHHLQHHHHHLQSLQSPSSLSSLSFVTQYPVARAANQTEPVENSSAGHHLVGKLQVNGNVGQVLKSSKNSLFPPQRRAPRTLGSHQRLRQWP